MSVPGVAHAVPAGLAQQGRFINDKGLPLTGPHALTISLYDSPVGGAPVWTETQPIVLDIGYYSVTLGDDAANPIPESLLQQYPLYLGVALDDGEEFTPRHEVVSVPYAVLAHTAVNLDGGVVDAQHIAVNGQLVIDGGGHWVGPPIDVVDTLEALGCTAGQGIVFDGGSWTCVAFPGGDFARANQACPPGHAATGVDAAGTLLCAPDRDALAGLSCVPGQIVGWDGGAWVCVAAAEGDITGVLTGPGLVGGGSAGDVELGVAFGGSGGSPLVAHADHGHGGEYLPAGGNVICPPGMLVQAIDPSSGSVLCAPDQDTDTDTDTNTTYAAGAGLSLTGTTFAVIYGAGGSANAAVRADDPRLSDTRPPAPGSGHYIQNQFGGVQPASFNISGQGALGGVLTVNGGQIMMSGKEALQATDGWLRLNQAGQFPSGVHTPGNLGPGALNVGGANGWGHPGAGNMWVAGTSTLYGAVVMPSCRLCFYYADENGNDDKRAMCVRFEPGSFSGFMNLAGDVDGNDVIGMKYLCDGGPAGTFSGWPWL